jgi:hypothetical protein
MVALRYLFQAETSSGQRRMPLHPRRSRDRQPTEEEDKSDVYPGRKRREPP